MTAANALRGEVALELGGVATLLRPSFAALVAAEAEVGSLFAVLERAASGDVRLTDIEALAWHCSGASGDRAAFGAALLAAGLPALLAPHRALLASVFRG